MKDQKRKKQAAEREAEGTVKDKCREGEGVINDGKAETSKMAAPEKKTPREEAYDWLIAHHVTARMMDVVIAVCLILLLIVIVAGKH
jgi:hypothetical protein